MVLFQKLIDWYSIHCNGNWEHSYGFEINTLDNPGISLSIDLNETCLKNKSYIKELDNGDFDWYSIESKNNKFTIACSPNNFNTTLQFFFEDFFINYFDSEFLYEIFIPYDDEFILSSQAVLTKDLRFKIKEIDVTKIYKLNDLSLEKTLDNANIAEELPFKIEEIVEVILTKHSNYNLFQGNDFLRLARKLSNR